MKQNTFSTRPANRHLVGPSMGFRLATAALSIVVSGALLTSPVLAKNENVIATKTKKVNGKKYKFTKYLTEDGRVVGQVVDAKGKVVKEKDVSRGKKSQVGQTLRALLEGKKGGKEQGVIKVNIALDLGDNSSDETPEMGEAEVVQGNTTSIKVNGKILSEGEFEERVKGQARVHREKGKARMERRKAKMAEWSTRQGLETHSAILDALEKGQEMVTLELTKGELVRLIQGNDPMISGVELYEPLEDDITSAMAATSITTFALPYSTTQGDGIGIYMTERGCPKESRLNNYDRLSEVGVIETDHSRNVSAILRAVSPDSFIYCRGGGNLPTSVDLNGGVTYGYGGGYYGWRYTPPLDPPIQIVTMSAGNNDTMNYSTWDREWDNYVYSHNFALFKSAGNNGASTGNVTSPGKGFNVITVGNYNDANNTINNSSSFVDPNIGTAKPEISAPGTNITAGGFRYTGTSQAAPHAAAFSADMMSSSTYLKGRPYMLKAQLMAGATDAIDVVTGRVVSDTVGLGGIDFASAFRSGQAKWWTGSNSAFNYFAANDGGTSNTYIEKRVYIGRWWDRARVVVSWLTRGSYTYTHQNDAHPIGMDLDLRVYDPYGRYVGGSFSFDNSYEKVEFTPTVSGYYTFKINRYANRDTSLNLRMGMYVNFFNN